MRRIGQFLGRATHREPRGKQRLTALRPSAWLSARFEPLEPRQLLAANILASLEGNLATAGDVHSLQLTIDGGQSALIGLRMQHVDGNIDPDSLRIETLAGHTIAPVLSQADNACGNESVLLVELAPGSYSVITKAENGTTGAYLVDVFLVGDLSGDGAVDDHEALWASGAVVQHMGTANYVTRMFYQSRGIDLSQDLYCTEIDTDFDGDCDNADLGRINENKGVWGISAVLVGDDEAPAIQAALVSDTGRSATDGITNQLAVAGTISDEREIVAFRAGLDGMDPADYVSVLAEVDAGGNFLFDQARLESILGGSVANNGPHTLHLLAEDDLGNTSATPYNVTFTLDTIAPAAPTSLDLLASSDLGHYDNDDVTSDTTPTILAQAETSSLVRLYSSIHGFVGEAIATSPVSITAPALADGDHDFTATATDLAGNLSAASVPLSVLIETVAPVVPTLELAAASDTGTVGDRLTSLVSVTLEGLAEAGSRMTLVNTGASVMADATGAFSIGAVPLSFGDNSLTVTSMDLAGNTSSFTQTIRQNNAPSPGAYGPIAVDEDPGVQTYDLAGVFTDVNLVDGDTLALSIVGNTNPSLVTPSLTGTSGQVTNNSLRLTFGQNQNGTATITVRATDAAGEFTETDIVVNVAPVNDAPVTEDTTVAHVEENGFVDVDLRTRFQDVETADDDLAFALVSPTGQFGLGTAEILADGHTLRFTPNANVNGLDYVQVRVTDTGEGASPAKTITGTVIYSIDPFNDPPEATGASLATDEDTAVQIDLWTLTGDTETADAALSYVVAGAEHGSVALVDGHIARFTPAANYNGPARFTYTVTDTGDGTSPAKSTGPVTIDVTVNPVNDAPVASATTLTTAEDTAVTIDLRTLVTDVETADDALIFTVAGATNGTVELIDGHTARFTPTGQYHGPASFTYSVQDTGDGAAAAKTVGPVSIGVTVTPVNDTPVAVGTSLTTDEDAAVTVDLRTLVSDVETADDALIFTVAGATNGTVTLVDGHTARFTPAENYNGPASFTYSVQDTGDGTAAAKTVGPVSIGVTVGPINDAPIALPTALMTDEDASVTVDLRTLVTDVETADDALIFTVAGATNGTVELIDGHTARFTPTGEYHGPASFTYSVEDTGDGTAAAKTAGPISISVTVAPVNDTPVADGTSLTTDEDFAVEVDLRTLVSDKETADEDLIFTVGDAANGTVTLVDGHIARFTPNGNFNNNRGSASFTYSVTDTGDGTAAAKTVGPVAINVSVTPVNDSPTTGDDSRSVANDESTTIDVLANDTDPDLIEGDTISIVSVTQGSQNGTVVISDGKIVYTPVDLLGGEGAETFSYTIRDTAGLTATQVVTLTVVANSQPVAEPDTASTNEDATIGGNVLTNDHDDDGDTLEVIAFDAVSTRGAVVTVASDGTFSYDPTGAAALQALSNGQPVDDTFTYTISDGQGGTAVGTVTVHVTGMNDEPTATAKTGETNEDATLSKPAGFLLDGAQDPDANDTLSINVGASDGTSDKGATVAIQADGSFVYDPTGSAVLQGLAQGESTTDTFQFVVDDGNGGQHSAVVTITVTGINDEPTARADSFQTNEDTTLVADETRNVLDNDTDPDTNDVLVVVVAQSDTVSAEGAAVTIHADGTFVYNPGSLFNHLAVGQSAQDTFSYTMSDGHVTKTATVTLSITGVNDDPTAVADSATTSKLTPIDLDVVDNDTDPDTSDVLAVGTFAATSTMGATITLNGDGTLKYNPLGSATLQALGTGQQAVDTFTYAVSDGHGGTASTTVSVTVTGSSEVLYVANPIADMTLTDATSPQPSLIDLNTVFDAPAGVSLSFTATSSNTELVQVSIVGGNQLQVTYVTYTTDQDRTPAVVTVTATDNMPVPNQVSDQFNVTVIPEETVGVYLVIRQTATPVGQASGNTLPTSLDEVAVGSTYVVEVWMQDVYGASVTGGPSQGLTGGEFDIAFDNALGEATGLSFEGPYFAAPPFQTGTINNGAGLIDDFGSGVLTAGLSVAPLYTRLGYATFTASTAGTQEFTLSEPTVSRFGAGNLDLTQLNLGSASVDQVVEMQSLTFNVSSRSQMQITGTVLGTPLERTSGSSDMAAGLTGTLEVLVDNPANPTRLRIAAGSLDVTTNTPEGRFVPGPGGTTVPDYADFAFTAEPMPSELLQMALREMAFSLSTDAVLALSGVAFDANLIDMPLSAGFADVRYQDAGSRGSLTGLVAEPTLDETGTWQIEGDVYTLQFVYWRTIDLSSYYPNTVLTISGTYVAEYDTTPGIMGTEVAADAPTVAAMTLVKQPTAVDANGQVSALPQSEAWIDEWDSYWVEVWVKTSEAAGISAGSVDLTYNSDYFTATEIDHGTVYVDDVTGSLDQDGLISGLGGSTTLGNVGGAGYVLLGRVKFESLGDDGVAMDAENQVLAPHDLGLELSNLRIEGTGAGVLDAAVGRAPQTQVWAVPYDVDDSGRIDLGDLSYFAATYRDDVLTSDTPFVWALDFDHTGSVDLGDLSFLASNYGLARGGAVDVVFPENFLQSWVGAGLDVEGETAVGDLLDAAIATWQDLLGSDEPIVIQLVVEDFGTSQLGQGQILEIDADGVPTLGRVTIDDDANGLGWYSTLDSLPGEGQYDLYTVLLHEIGHTLGFMLSYEGFASQVETDAYGNIMFVGDDFSAPLDASGQHIDADVLADDVMTASLAPGVRKLPSELDARILLAAYEAAGAGASGFAAMSAAMVAGDAATGTLVGAVSTAEFDRLDGKLEGDVTWDRLLGGRSGRDSSATDAADAIHESDLAVDFTGSALSPTRARRHLRIQDDSGNLDADEILVELAATRDVRRDGPHALDALFSEWEDVVVKDATTR